MLELLDTFPREIGLPERVVVKNLDEFFQIVNANNGKRTVFGSIYEINPDPRLISITKIFFDMDSPQKLEVVRKLHSWAMDKNYKHTLAMSGNGFHFYLFTKNYMGLNNPKQALKNAHHAIAKEVKLTIGSSKVADLDSARVGDIRSFARVIGSFNLKAGRYCIPVTAEDLEKGLDFIYKKAAYPHLNNTIYGKELFDIAPFDGDVAEQEQVLLPGYVAEEQGNIALADEHLANLPPCIKEWLTNAKTTRLGHDKRGWVVMWMRDKGLWYGKINKPLPALYEETVQLLKRYLSTDEFAHMNANPEWAAPKYLYFTNRNNGFPSCDRIKEAGGCPIKNYCFERNMF